MVWCEILLVTSATAALFVNGLTNGHGASKTDLLQDEDQLDIERQQEQEYLDIGSLHYGFGAERNVVNNIGIQRDYVMDLASDQEETKTERGKRCLLTVSCTRAGGYCVRKSRDCNGTLDKYGCRGNKNCKCCIPDEVSTVAPTCPETTCPTCPAVTSTTCPVCPEVTCTPYPTSPVTTLPPSTTTTECPGGFLMMNQCFRIFNDTMRSWEAAQSKCRMENLILAEPSDSVAAPLREYVLNNYGSGDYQCWLGARGDGSKFVWQHSGKSLFNNNTLWDNAYLSSSLMSSRKCLELDSLQSEWTSEPQKPYDAYSCTGSRWTLCEDATATTPTHTTTASTATTSDMTSTIPATTSTAPITTTSGQTHSPNLNWTIAGHDRFVRFPQIMNWTDARILCRSIGLDIYQPRSLITLSTFLDDNFGTMFYWVNAKGNGTHMIWLSGDVLTRGDPWYGTRYSYVQSNDCLYYYASASYAARNEVLWAFTDSCSRGNLMRVLCG